MLDFDFHNDAGHWICLTAHLYRSVMNDELIPQGITYRQCQVLGWVALEGCLSQVELAQRMNIEPPTLVPILDRMEAEGFLIREKFPGDRRRKIVKPLPAANKIWNKIVRTAKRIRTRATRGMTDQQIQTLKNLLEMVRANLCLGEEQQGNNGTLAAKKS